MWKGGEQKKRAVGLGCGGFARVRRAIVYHVCSTKSRRIVYAQGSYRWEPSRLRPGSNACRPGLKLGKGKKGGDRHHLIVVFVVIIIVGIIMKIILLILTITIVLLILF
jgi:hypothetical protein